MILPRPSPYDSKDTAAGLSKFTMTPFTEQQIQAIYAALFALWLTSYMWSPLLAR